MKEQMKKTKFLRGIVILLMLIFVIANFMHWAKKKEVVFCDEFYSYEMANAQEEWCELYNSNIWRSGEWLNNYIAATDKNLGFGLISQHVRPDHVPLYTWLFRIVSIIFLGSSTKWIGLSINLLCLIGIFAEVFFILHKMAKQSSIVSAIGAAAYCIHPLVLNSALMIRMYLMFQCILIFMLIIFERLLHGERNKKTYCELFLIAVCGFLTHKYIWLCLAILSFLYCLYLFRERAWKEFRKFVFLMIGVAGTVTLLFPYWLPDLFVHKGARTLVKAIKFWKEGWLKEIAWGLSRVLIDVSTFGTAFYEAEIFQSGNLQITTGTVLITFFVLLALFTAYILKKKGERECGFCMLGIVSSFVYAIVVARTMPSPFYANRYIWPISGVILLLVIMAFLGMMKELLQKRSEKTVYIGSIFAATIIFIAGVSLSWNGRGLDYVNGNGEERKDVILQYKETPCVVYCESLNFEVISSYWDYILFDNVCWVNEKEDGDTELKKILDERKEIVIYIKEDEKSLLDGYTAEKLFQSYYMGAYLIKE